MFGSAATRFARSLLSPHSKQRTRTRRTRLGVESMEERAVPANNLTITDGGSFNVTYSQNGSTLTVSTIQRPAQLDIDDLEYMLRETGATNVVLTTSVANGGTNYLEAGNIIWDRSVIGRDLRTENFPNGATLTFRPDSGARPGQIQVLGATFGAGPTGGMINLDFDTTQASSGNPGVGDISFLPTAGGPTVAFGPLVSNLTVRSNHGAFTYASGLGGEAVDVSGTVSLTVFDSITLANGGGIHAVGPLSITGGAITIISSSLTTDSDLSISGPAITIDSDTNLTAGAKLSIGGSGAVSIGSSSSLTAGSELSISGPVSIGSDGSLTSGADLSLSGTVSIGSDSSLTAGAKLSFSGAGLTIGSGSNLTAASDLNIILPYNPGSAAVSIAGTNLTSTGGGIRVQGTSVTAGGAFRSAGLLSVFSYGLLDLSPQSDLQSSQDRVSITGDYGLRFGGQIWANVQTDVKISGGLGAVILTGDTTITNPNVQFYGTVDGAVNLTVIADQVKFNKAVGSTAPLGRVDLPRASLTTEGNPFSASELWVGVNPGPNAPVALLGESIGVIHANVVVGSNVKLVPGGNYAVGTLTIDGNLQIDGGTFSLDLGADAVDRIDLIGEDRDLIINGGQLTDRDSYGRLTREGDLPILSYTGTRTGAFTNLQDGDNFFVYENFLQLGHQPTAITVALIPANPGNTLTASDTDGTEFTLKLTGPGKLMAVVDPTGVLQLATRGTTAQSKVTLVTRPSDNGAADGFVRVGTVSLSGSLGAFSAPAADVLTTMWVVGAVKSIAIHDLSQPADQMPIFVFGDDKDSLTLRGHNLTGGVYMQGRLSVIATGRVDLDIGAGAGIGQIKAQSIDGTINSSESVGPLTAAEYFSADVYATKVASVRAANLENFTIITGDIGSLTATGRILGQVNAQNIGTLRAGTTLQSTNPWYVSNGIKSLSAGAVQSFNLSSGFIGTMSVVGNPKQQMSGDINSSVIHLNGLGLPGVIGLKSLTAKGTVRDSRFTAFAHVRSVTVGRFINSQFYLSYSPTTPFETASGFSDASLKLGKFTTTAALLGDESNPDHFAFAGSEIAAGTIGTVRLSSLRTKNNGVTFGIKSHATGGSVRVKAVDDTAVALNKNLAPTSTTQAGDFFYLQV